MPAGGVTVELEARVHGREVVVRADLHGPVAEVAHEQPDAQAARVQLHRLVAGDDLAWTHPAPLTWGS